MTPTLGFHLQPKQLEVAEHFAQANARHNAIIGGARSGKTFLFTRAMCLRAMAAPTSRHFIVRLRTLHVRQSIWMDTLPKVQRLIWPDVKWIRHEADGFMTFPDKTVPMEDYSELWIAGLDDKDRVEKILGKEATTIYFNECSQIPYASVLTVITRLAQKVAGLRQRAYYDLNPVLTGHWTHRMFLEQRDPDSRERKLLADPESYAHAFMNPEDNAANLDPEYLQSLRNMPARQRIRFYEGKYSTEMEGQLWTYDLIENHRKNELAPEELAALGIYRIVVAVDPSGAAGEFDTKADEIGIIVVARNAKRGFVLEDASGLYSPEQWGKITCRLYHKWNADRVVGEKNFGGDMVRAVIQGADPNVAFKAVTASRGKAVRAEPVAAYYERGLISHCGQFPVLEDELLNFTTLGYMGTGSPNHCFVAGTLVRTATGQVPIEQIRIGDLVHTRMGLQKVKAAGFTGVAPVLRLRLSGDQELLGTANHPVFVKGKGFIRLDALVWGDILEAWPKKQSLLTALSGPAIRKLGIALVEFTSGLGRKTNTGNNRSIVTCGLRSMDQSQKENWFIIKTRTHSTIKTTTLSASLTKSTRSRMLRNWGGILALMWKHWMRRLNGIDHQKVLLGIKEKVRHLGVIVRNTMSCAASFVERSISPISSARINSFALAYADHVSMRAANATILTNADVLSAKRFSTAASMIFNSAVPVSVVGLSASGMQPVFNLSVDGEPEFYANDVLVHNCDALVWGLSELFERGDGGGLVDYLSEMDEGLKSGAVAMVNGIPQQKVEAKTAIAKIATSAMIKPVIGDDTSRCPNCGSAAIVKIGKNVKCNQCGAQSSSGSDVPLPAGARRSEYLNK